MHQATSLAINPSVVEPHSIGIMGICSNMPLGHDNMDYCANNTCMPTLTSTQGSMNKFGQHDEELT
jgi:hypothetical protein